MTNCCLYYTMFLCFSVIDSWFRANISQHRILHHHGIAFADFDCELWRIAHWHPESWLFVFFSIWLLFGYLFFQFGNLFFFNLVIIWLFGFFYLVVCFFFLIWLFGYLVFSIWLFVFSMWFFDLVLPNPRKLEDKLLNHRLEFRTFFLPMDLSQLHHNREMPAGFTFFLCVSDTTLPAKGTAHRANRNAGKVRGSKQSHSKHPWINFPVKEIYEYIYYTTYIIL